MAFPEDISPTEVCCEICGIRLEDEIVIQEFADGSLARLCPECAAGAVFDPVAETDVPEEARTPARPVPPPEEPAVSVFPDITENDPMEMTKELLMPVADLIGLQSEMQVALERLAASLERFATGVVSDTIGRSTDVDNRIKSLESELERTRARLRETESLLVTTTPPPATGAQEAVAPAGAPLGVPPETSVLPVVPLPTEEPSAGSGEAPPVTPSAVPEAAAYPTAEPEQPSPTLDETVAFTPPTWPDATPATPPQAAPPQGEGAEPQGVFCLDEIRNTQRLFNESPFVERVRSVQRSLGKPKANLSRVAGAEPRVLVTVIWDIIWYQYLVDLRLDIPSSERVTCFREGMEMDELAAHFQEKNAIIDEDGRLDASEIEVRLLSDPTVLITEMPVDVEQALEDATEEIWDQRISPEFKWDD